LVVDDNVRKNLKFNNDIDKFLRVIPMDFYNDFKVNPEMATRDL